MTSPTETVGEDRLREILAGWQDISTAPKDGTEVLLAFNRAVWCGRYLDGDGWYETNNHPTDTWGYGELHPTHWMPLPKPPAFKEQSHDEKLLNPSPALLVKLGSMIVHAEEAASGDGHDFDRIALKALANDPEVAEWLAGMRAAALLPVKRKSESVS